MNTQSGNKHKQQFKTNIQSHINTKHQTNKQINKTINKNTTNKTHRTSNTIKHPRKPSSPKPQNKYQQTTTSKQTTNRK